MLAWSPSAREHAQLYTMPIGQRIAPEIVLAMAVYEFGVSLDDLVGPCRTQRLVIARAFVVWVLRSVGPQRSYPKIARIIGREDHTTAIHLHQKAVELRLRDTRFVDACRRIARFHHETTEANHGSC